jgi:hypothetical protein
MNVTHLIRFLVSFLGLALLPSLARAACPQGYSEGIMDHLNARAKGIEATVSEIRGDGLWYLIRVDLSKKAAANQRSASNTTTIELYLPATTANLALASRITQQFTWRQVEALCVRSLQIPYSLPDRPFQMEFGLALEGDPQTLRIRR